MESFEPIWVTSEFLRYVSIHDNSMGVIIVVVVVV